MLDIDFLPAQYHRRQARQRSKPWQAIVLVAFVGLVAFAALGQYRERRRLRSELEQIEPRYEQAIAQRAKLDTSQHELRAVRAEAALLTYLRHPWPRTQLFQALLTPLPDEVVLAKLEISGEGRLVQKSPEQRPPQTTSESEPSSDTPAERDLAELRQKVDGMETVIRLSGTTSDGAALHRYLGELARNPLFRKAELESIESANGGAGELPKFDATIVVQPGYGQPGGPTGPDPEAVVRH